MLKLFHVLDLPKSGIVVMQLFVCGCVSYPWSAMKPEVDRVNCYWLSSAQSFLVPSPSGLIALYYCHTIPGVAQLCPSTLKFIHVKIMLRPVGLGVKPHLGPKTRFLLLSRQLRVS
jgi:hypothetical protein